MNRTNLINYLIAKNNYTSYLEIGLAEGFNFSLVNCDIKESVDPFISEDHKTGDMIFTDELPEHILNMLTYRMTSDEFFEQNKKTYDIIFIDGLHEQYQVMKDIIHALDIISENGIILIHDCLPETEEAQIVPRCQVTWNGDVWKGIAELIKQGVNMKVIDTDCGIGIIKRIDNTKTLDLHPLVSNLTWNDFVNNRNELLHVISENEFISHD